MTNTTKSTEVTESETPCECSNYDALIPDQLTEENLADGNVDYFDTGCTSTTRNTFAPGHDAKLKSFLIAQEVAGNEIRRTAGGMAVSRSAVEHASQFAFAHMVEAGIAKASEKAKAQADRKAARAARKAAKGVKKAPAASETHTVEHKPGKSLAEIVADEEAAHAEATKRSQPEPEWTEDEPKAPEQVEAKVGRWTYKGTLNQDGTFSYAAKLGGTKTVEAGKFQLV